MDLDSHAGEAFGTVAAFYSEIRVLDCEQLEAEVSPLPAGELYTTYSYLKRFLMAEIERMVPGRVAFHEKHELKVHSPSLS
jgi:hypothetical protein